MDPTRRLKERARNFALIKKESTEFVQSINEKIEDTGLYINEGLPEIRRRKETRMVDQRSDDTEFSISEVCFQVNTLLCYNDIMDIVVRSMTSRFLENGDLYKDLSLFDPNSSKEIQSVGIPAG